MKKDLTYLNFRQTQEACFLQLANSQDSPFTWVLRLDAIDLRTILRSWRIALHASEGSSLSVVFSASVKATVKSGPNFELAKLDIRNIGDQITSVMSSFWLDRSDYLTIDMPLDVCRNMCAYLEEHLLVSQQN